MSVCSLRFENLQRDNSVKMQRNNDPFTHHIEVDHLSLVSGSLIQRAVLSNSVLPGAVEVVAHDVEVVQDSGEHT